MALRNPPSWLQNGSHPAENDRLTITGTIWQGAGVVDYGDMKVTATGTPSMAVVVAAGSAVVAGSQTATQGNYIAYNDAAVTTAISASNPSLARIDRVCLVVQDAFYGGTANNQILIQVVTGTPSGSPVAPSAPANSLTIATVLVAAAVTTITSGAITDTRVFASFTDTVTKASNTLADSLTINAIASQTGKAIRVNDSTGTLVYGVSPAGVVTFPDGSTQATSSVYNPNLTINAQTGTTYTINATDAQKFVTFTNAAAQTITLASNSVQALATGTQVQIAQLGAGQVTIVGATTPTVVTVNGTPGLKLRTQYSVATLVQLSTNNWLVIGDTTL
jgi:hypothetical protein